MNSDLVFQMQQQDFYPHVVDGTVELVQTHASIIFLTGKYAYKIKKEVNFGFLDYSTLAKRKHFIELELSLNQKIAPELYLEVLPISNCDNQLILNNSEQIVEYALKMRQFPQEDLFSNLLNAGKLNEDRFIELGKIVAQFHQNAETNDYISSFGTVAKISAAFEENYQQSQKYVGIVQTGEQFEATKAYTDAFFTQKSELLRDRVKQQKIKQCHGDLHLKNICLWRDRIRLFDRIEFNESFRFVDTMYDVAFTVMDLSAKGNPELANAFLNSYLEYTGDWTGLLVLPLYLSRQAYVRAKVNSLLLDDPQIDRSDKQEAKKTASDYYRQAYLYTQPKSGSLIMMSGLSGSGKSTVARTIAKSNSALQQARGTARQSIARRGCASKSLDSASPVGEVPSVEELSQDSRNPDERSKGKFGVSAILIRSDAVRKHLAGVALDESGTDEIYSDEMTQKTYNRLLELGIMLAGAGYNIILDAKYDRVALRQSVIERAKDKNIPLTIVCCTAPLSVLRDRLKQRQNDISDATADLLTAQRANAEPFTAEEQAYLTTVDTSQSNWQEQL